MLDDFHRLSSALDARERRLVRRAPARRRVQLVLSTRTDPGAAARHAARPRAAARAARRRAALHGRARPASSSTGASGSSSTPADVELLVARTEGWPAGIYLAALSLAGTADQHALVARVRRHERARRRLPRERGARRPRAGAAGVHAAHVGARAAVRAAVRRGRSGDAGSADALDVARAHEPLPAPARRPPPVVPLPPPVRPDPARRARAARARRSCRRCTGARSRGTASTARPTRRSTTPSPPARSREAGGADRRDLGPLRQRRPDRLGADWLRALPAAVLDGDRAAAARPGLGRRRCAAARPTCAPRSRSVRALGGLDDGPLPDGFASLESSLSVLSATFGWGDVVGDPRARRRARPQLEGPDSPWRPVITWALGWAHYCNGDLDAGRALADARRPRSRPPADQWIVGVAAIADLSLIAGLRGDRAEQLRLAQEAVELARDGRPARRGRGRRGAHGATASRSPRTAAARRRCPSSSRASSCAGCGRSRSTSIDGLIALAPTVAATRRPRARGGAVRRGGGARRRPAADPGALPGAARRPRRRAGAAGRPAAGATS